MPCDDLEGVRWERGDQGRLERGDTCILSADSRCCRAEIDTIVKQLSSKLKNLKVCAKKYTQLGVCIFNKLFHGIFLHCR